MKETQVIMHEYMLTLLNFIKVLRKIRERSYVALTIDICRKKNLPVYCIAFICIPISLVAQMVRRSACNAGDPRLDPG